MCFKNVARCSLPDLPLTARELQLLEETNHLATTSGLSYSADDILGVDDHENEDTKPEAPPPKPPLPPHVDFVKLRRFV